MGKATIATIGVLLWADVLAIYTIWMMMPYLTNVWEIGFTRAASILNVFSCTVLVLPMLLQFIVDKFIGNYGMLLLSSFSYCAGFNLLTMSTPPILGTCSEYKPECLSQGQEILFFAALALIAFGFSGHICSLGRFLSEQTELSETEITQISPWEFAAAVAVPVIAAIAISYIRPWTIRFLIPAICAVAALVIFYNGSCSYNYRTPEHTSTFTCVFRDFVQSKTVLPRIPILINIGLVSSIGGTYFIEQASHMNSNIGSIYTPLPLILLLSYYSGTYIVKLVCRRRELASQLGIIVSMIVAILCCVTAAMVEARRLGGLINDKVPMSMFWLVPQFVLLGCFDGIADTNTVSFLTKQFPALMEKHVLHTVYGICGVGHMGSVVTVYVVGLISKMEGKQSWFQHNLDESRLDNYYWTLAALTAINLAVYIVKTWKWNGRQRYTRIDL